MLPEGVTAITVVSSQGREYTYTILDAVIPGGPDCSLGFLVDRRRMVVGLSRAKDGLVIIGSLELGIGAKGADESAWRRRVKTHLDIGAVHSVHETGGEVSAKLGVLGRHWKHAARSRGG